MHSSPNLPEYKTGDSVRSQSLNEMASAARSLSANSNSTGIHGYSTSSGNALSLDEVIQKGPFWAMVTGVRRKYGPGQYPSLTDPDCPAIAAQFEYCFPPYNPERCPNYWYAHSWVELVEDYNLSKHGEEIFSITVDSKLPAYQQPLNNINKLETGEPLEVYKRSCRAIYGEYMPSRGMQGNIHEYPLYEVNNLILPKGYVTIIYPGKGAYMLVEGYDGYIYDTSFLDKYLRSQMGFLPQKDMCCSKLEAALNSGDEALEQLRSDTLNFYLSDANVFREPGPIVRSSYDPGFIPSV